MFRFISPEYLYALWLVPCFIALYLWRQKKQHQRWKQVGDLILLKKMMPERSAVRNHVKFALCMLVLVLLVLVMSRPQYGMSRVKTSKKGIEVSIMMDVSNSMMAQDIMPNRLERAKLLISTLIDKLNNDKIALGVFAGEAYPQMPMTYDYGAAKMILSSLSPRMVSSQGTNIAAALDVANKSFGEQKKVGKAIILITDGEDHEGNVLETAKAIAKSGVHIYIVGVGTSQGAEIPTPDGPFIGPDGEPVITRFDDKTCKEIAEAGNGLFLKLDNSDIAQQQLLSSIGKLQAASTEEEFNVRNDQFQAFGVIALLLLLTEFFLMNKKNVWWSRFKIFRHED